MTEITIGSGIDATMVLEAYIDVLDSSDATIRDEADLPYERRMIKEAILQGLEVAEPEERDPLEQAYLSLAYFQNLTDEEAEAVRAFEMNESEDEGQGDDVAKSLAAFGEAYQDVLRRIERDAAVLSAELADRESEDDE